MPVGRDLERERSVCVGRRIVRLCHEETNRNIHGVTLELTPTRPRNTVLREADVTRSERLLALIQALRRHRRPVTAQQLAAELSASVRTIYRAIDTLVAQGASIEI